MYPYVAHVTLTSFPVVAGSAVANMCKRLRPRPWNSAIMEYVVIAAIAATAMENEFDGLRCGFHQPYQLLRLASRCHWNRGVSWAYCDGVLPSSPGPFSPRGALRHIPCPTPPTHPAIFRPNSRGRACFCCYQTSLVLGLLTRLFVILPCLLYPSPTVHNN